MLSVIDVAPTAPVLVQEHEMRVSVVDAAKDGTATLPLRRDPSDKWLANAADRTNTPPIPISSSSDSGHWWEQDLRQHNPRPRRDLNDSPGPSTSPSPTSQAPTDEPNLLNPPSPNGNAYLNLSPYQGLTDNSDK
jgi:hypothetical protein